LTERYIIVPPSFPRAAVDSIKEAVKADSRLVAAANQAQDGKLAQYLAGAPDLLHRYQVAPDAPRALITAAMDIRHLGHGLAIPKDLLKASTPAHLTDDEWEGVSQMRSGSRRLSITPQRRATATNAL
jgi:hypothetical protein